jgi:peptidoglycan hydrolase CwlO-like protein
LAAQALAGKKKSSASAQSGINGDIQAGGDVARSFIMGKYNTAGSIVWVNTWGKDDGTPNAWLTQVIALSDVPVKGLLEVWVDGARVTYDPAGNNNTIFGYSIPEYVKSGANLYVKFYDGRQTVADPAIIANATSADRTYDGSRVGYGVAYAVVHSRSTKGMFSGIPSLKFTVDGMALYDISKDSSVGGVGPQRYADPATWGGDGDYLPAVQLYNLWRGIRYNAAWVYGMQNITTARLPSDNWINAVIACRTPIQDASGATVNTYRSGLEVSVDTPLSDAADALLTACQGKIAELGGIYRIYLGAPGSPTISFSDDDILSTEEQSFTPFFGLSDTINGITATYGDERTWETTTAPPLYRTDLESLAGNRRLLSSVEFHAVTNAEQVQRLMKSALLTAQRARRHTIVLPPKYWAYAVPGEVISWNSERNGYIDKLFQIDGVNDRANCDVMLDITEVDPEDYDWTPSTDYKPPVDGALGPITPQPQAIVDWFAEPYTLLDNDGVARRPAIRLVWSTDPETLVNVEAIKWQIRDATSFVVLWVGSTNIPEAGQAIISQGLLPNTNYQVSGAYVPEDSDRETLWSSWIPVTTPNVLLGSLDIYAPGIVEGIKEFISDATLWIRDGVRQAYLDAQRNTRITADQDYGTFTSRQEMRVELSASTQTSINTLTAQYTSDILTATGPNSALSQRIDSLNAELTDTQSQVTSNAGAIQNVSAGLTIVDGRITSVSQDLTTLTSVVNDANAGIAANSTAISQLITRTDKNEEGIVTASQNITTLTSNLSIAEDNIAANATAVNALTTRVTSNEDGITSLSQSLTDVNATITDLDGQVQGNASTIQILSASVSEVNGVVSAQADLINSVNATVGDVSASANFRATVYAAQAGYSSRIGLEARAGSAGVYRSASLFLDVPSSTSSPTRVAIVADQFSITNGSANSQPFVFQGGVLTLNAANIGTVTAGLINGGPGAKMVIDITNGTITVSD